MNGLVKLRKESRRVVDENSCKGTDKMKSRIQEGRGPNKAYIIG
jgi:hypothetical protein